MNVIMTIVLSWLIANNWKRQPNKIGNDQLSIQTMAIMALEGSKCVLIHGSWSGSLLAWMLDNAADQSN